LKTDPHAARTGSGRIRGSGREWKLKTLRVRTEMRCRSAVHDPAI
jgi:hypothetical protein